MKKYFFMLVQIMLLVSATIMAVDDSSVQTLYEKQGCHLHGYQLNITVHDCKTVLLSIATCLGACISVDVPTIYPESPVQYSKPYKMKQIGKCCRTFETSEVTVELKCFKNGRLYNRYHSVKSAVSCDCFTCRGL